MPPAAGTVPFAPGSELPELASVRWRPRVDARSLRRRGRGWTRVTLAHTVPFIVAGVLLAVAKPVLIPISLILFAHAWLIPELYANKGAGVMRPRRRAGASAEATALGLLGDLLDTGARELHAGTGLALQRGALGVWLVGEAGALVVAPGGRRVSCFCVRVTGDELPASDRISHLLLALRADEAGFATVANLAFSGAPWRIRRRLLVEARPGLAAAVRVAKAVPKGSRR
jgi:hypothetical protein